MVYCEDHFRRGRTMIVRALFFASYRDIAGTDEVQVELPGGARVSDLIARLRATGGSWLSLPASPAVAVNLDYSPLSTALADGDEIAFIPPVAGG
ncbi:MAG: MoaD/ThiS family protein [Gemmatimonadetes bacterium]|nr:MoaD/ThiS family protein [Gemmatimonadota bacterium]